MLEICSNEKEIIEVEKSKFISYAFKIDNLEQFNKIHSDLKKEHFKAKHICYAYKIDNEIKFSDDGEPSGTAGKPILSVIEKENLTNIAIFVVRYFGGILLGSGRLLRTYIEATKLVINKAKKVELIKMYDFKVLCEYDCINQFKYFLKSHSFIIKSLSFNDKIFIEFLTPLSFNENLEELFYKKIEVIDKKISLYRKE